MQKKGLISARPTELTWRAELMWQAGPARIRHGMQGHVVELREPTRRTGGAQVARMRGKGHTSPRGHPGGATW